MDRIELFKKVPLFSTLPENYYEYLLEKTLEKEYKRDDIILKRGERSGFLGILLSGKLKVSMLSSKGGEMSLDILKPYRFIGEISLLDNKPHSASVVAMKKSKMLILLEKDFEKLLSEVPDLSLFLLRRQVKMLRRLNNKVADLSFMDLSQRAAKKLVDLDSTEKGKVIEITHQEFAGLVGCNRESATRVLNDFERKEFIYMKKRRIKVVNQEGLKNIYRDYWVDCI